MESNGDLIRRIKINYCKGAEFTHVNKKISLKKRISQIK